MSSIRKTTTIGSSLESIPFDPSSHSHRRFNPLTQTWVLCSPHRTKRPWQGAVEPPSLENRPSYAKECYLCPGNLRAGGEKTEVYEETFVFENDFAALVETPISPLTSDPNSLFQTETARGKCYVICFSPRHDLTIAEMRDREIEAVIGTWTKVYKDLSKEYKWLKYITVFENKGSMMGCSNPHPHGQVWSLSYIPTGPLTILQSQKNYAHSSTPSPSSLAPKLKNGLPSILLEYVTQEISKHLKGDEDSRVILLGNHFVSLVPFWAGWPFESLILPYKRHISSLAELTPSEATDLAHTIGAISRRMDNLFECSFGYSMGLYQAPVHQESREVGGGERWEEYAQFHIAFYPPLLRSSTIKKFLVGFELFAETQRDITPEQAAKRLRDCSDVHYKVKNSSTV